MGKRLVSCFFDSRCIMPRGSACRNSACRNNACRNTACRNSAMYPSLTDGRTDGRPLHEPCYALRGQGGISGGVTSHQQPRQCRGAQGPKTVKGAQSAPNYVSTLLLDCVANVCRGGGQKIIVKPLGIRHWRTVCLTDRHVHRPRYATTSVATARIQCYACAAA